MKKIVLSFSFLIAVTAIIAQQVPREMVALEIGTGTWCTYCPGAAMGADDLLENGKFVAVVENHNGDPFANTYSNARNSFYGITGYPTAFFDGVLSVVGGSHTNSMYGSYLPKYNQRIALPSNIAMTMEVSNTGLDYSVNITMQKVGTLPAGTFKLRFHVTVSHIQYAWQGQTHLNFVNVLMVPGAAGTTVDFSSGDIQTVTLNFSMDPTWTLEDCEFITFLQNDSGKEILQTIKRAVVDLSADFNASSTHVDKNTQVTFTNATTGGYIGVPETYEWSFPGANPATSTDKNPTVFYKDCGEHDVTLIVNRGGQYDTIVKTNHIMVGPMAQVTSAPGDTTCWYQPITLDATDPIAATYLWEPGGATTPSIIVNSGQVGLGEHTFSVTLTSAEGCENVATHTIFFDACVGIDEQPGKISASVYPNPSNGSFILELSAPMKSIIDIQIVNTLGSIVYNETGILVNGKIQKNFNVDLSDGIYFLVTRSGSEKTVQKLFITR